MKPQNDHNSNIKDHCSQITIANIIMKTFEILRELPNMTQRQTRNEQMLLEKWR